jgi:hypothetical protein
MDAATTQGELVRPNRFIQLYPNVATSGALRWQLNNSGSNGLDAAGAVIRKHMRPDSTRPIILIDVPRYFRWLRGDANAAAA